MIYVAIMLALIVMSYIYDYRRFTQGWQICFWGMLIIFILVAGLRYRLGVDTLQYIKHFQKVNPLPELTSMDFARSRFAPGYIIMASTVKTFTNEFTAFQMLHSIIVNSVVFFFIKRYTRKVFISLFLFFIYMYFLLLFQQMRESLAVSIFLLAWPAFKSKNWLIWYGCALLAMTFHVSAVMMLFLPAIYLPFIRQFFVFGRRTFYISIGVLAFGMVVSTVFFKYIQFIAVTESMMERAQVYSKSELSGMILNFNGIIGKLFQNILYPFMAMYFIYMKRKKYGEETDPLVKKLEMMAILSLYVGLFAIPIPIISRYNNYLYIFSIIMISKWAFAAFPWLGKKIRLTYVSWVFLFVPMVGFQLYNTYLKGINPSGTLKGYMVYYPYSSYLDQTMDVDREKTFKYLLK